LEIARNTEKLFLEERGRETNEKKRGPLEWFFFVENVSFL